MKFFRYSLLFVLLAFQVAKAAEGAGAGTPNLSWTNLGNLGNLMPKMPTLGMPGFLKRKPATPQPQPDAQPAQQPAAKPKTFTQKLDAIADAPQVLARTAEQMQKQLAETTVQLTAQIQQANDTAKRLSETATNSAGSIKRLKNRIPFMAKQITFIALGGLMIGASIWKLGIPGFALLTHAKTRKCGVAQILGSVGFSSAGLTLMGCSKPLAEWLS